MEFILEEAEKEQGSGNHQVDYSMTEEERRRRFTNVINYIIKRMKEEERQLKRGEEYDGNRKKIYRRNTKNTYSF